MPIKLRRSRSKLVTFVIMRSFYLLIALLLVQVGYAHAQITQAEHEALIALYNSTDGANWSVNTNWLGPIGTECTWYGITCGGGLLAELNLVDNHLTGSIPLELGNLSNLQELWLSNNQMSGSIPAELGNLSFLHELHLNSNQLSGNIPSSFGMLTGLDFLTLDSNQLSGSIPQELAALTATLLIDLKFNALWTDDETLREFLYLRSPFWEESQTIAPTMVAAVPAANSAVSVSWEPILYYSDNGGYRVSYATASGGPYTFYGMTADKTDSSLIVNGLPPGITYYFIVESQTDPHFYNQNTVISEPSAEAVAVSQANPIPMLGTIGVIVFISALLAIGMWMRRN